MVVSGEVILPRVSPGHKLLFDDDGDKDAGVGRTGDECFWNFGRVES